MSPVAKEQRFLVTHGTQDPLLPVEPVIAIDWNYQDARHPTADELLKELNGKALVRPSGGSATATVYPDFMFVAIPNSTEGPGVVDVISLTSGFTRFDTDLYTSGVQSIPCPGARFLATYFRR